MTKIAVVTGGSGGIGKAICQQLAASNYRVIELSRSGKDFSGVEHITADVTDLASVNNAFEQIAEQTDGIDLLVNNAGMGISGAVEYADATEMKRQFDVNFFGVVAVTQAALPLLKVKRGKIFNISSVAAVTPLPFQAFYSASKSALDCMTLALANELRPVGVQATALLLGDIATGFTAHRVKDRSTNEYSERLARSVAAMEKDERNGADPKIVGKAVVKLAKKRNLKPTYTVGAKYKLFVALVKILPLSLVNKILYAMYAK